MKTKKQIEVKLKKFDKIETFNYGGGMPMSEWAMYSDKGWQAALRWVLEKGKK